MGSAPGFPSVLRHWYEFTQREREMGNIGEYRYLYLANLAGGGGEGDDIIRVEGADIVKGDGRAPPPSASWA
jgi:hypothetical protein